MSPKPCSAYWLLWGVWNGTSCPMTPLCFLWKLLNLLLPHGKNFFQDFGTKALQCSPWVSTSAFMGLLRPTLYGRKLFKGLTPLDFHFALKPGNFLQRKCPCVAAIGPSLTLSSSCCKCNYCLLKIFLLGRTTFTSRWCSLCFLNKGIASMQPIWPLPVNLTLLRILLLVNLKTATV